MKSTGLPVETMENVDTILLAYTIQCHCVIGNFSVCILKCQNIKQLFHDFHDSWFYIGILTEKWNQISSPRYAAKQLILKLFHNLFVCSDYLQIKIISP